MRVKIENAIPGASYLPLSLHIYMHILQKCGVFIGTSFETFMVNFMLYGQKARKVRMDFPCPHGKYAILRVFRFMYMECYEKNPRTGT